MFTETRQIYYAVKTCKPINKNPKASLRFAPVSLLCNGRTFCAGRRARRPELGENAQDTRSGFKSHGQRQPPTTRAARFMKTKQTNPSPPRRLKRMVSQLFVWLEEYKCGCTFMAHYKKDLPGYCEKHGEDRKQATLVPVPKNTPMGHAG